VEEGISDKQPRLPFASVKSFALLVITHKKSCNKSCTSKFIFLQKFRLKKKFCHATVTSRTGTINLIQAVIKSVLKKAGANVKKYFTAVSYEFS
jgi:hypothetical protein